MLWWALLAGSLAQEPPPEDWEFQAWEQLYDARLLSALGETPEAAVGATGAVMQSVRDENSFLRAPSHYWLALARLDTGDVAGARAELAILGPPQTLNPAQRALLERVESRSRAVVALPFRENFTDAADPSPWVRSWARGGGGDLTVDIRDENRVVIWTTPVVRGQDDRIYVPLALVNTGPSHIALKVRAEKLQARVRLVLEDDDALQWSAPSVQVSNSSWTEISLDLDDFTLASDPASPRRPNPRSLRAVYLVDLTGFRVEEGGRTNVLWIDDLVLTP